MIRKATKADIPRLLELAIEALKREEDQNLVIDEGKVRMCIEDCVMGLNNFCWVSERNGVISGSLGAMAVDLTFHERKQLQVLGWYSAIPGDGYRMMKQMVKWAATKPAIKQICFSMDTTFDKRIGDVAVRAGFLEVMPTFMLTR